MEFFKKYKEHYLKTLLLAWPVCLSNLGYILVGIVDAKMVGGIDPKLAGYDGTQAQAAVALANSFYAILLVLGIGISFGITPLVAAADASGDTLKKTEALKNSFLINFFINLGIFLILFLSSGLLRYLNQPPKVVELAIPFLNVMMFGLVPLSLFFTVKQFTEGLSLTMIPMFITLGGNLLNIILNYVLIYGHWGFSPMGLQGSCWASFISRSAMTIGIILYLLYNKRFVRYRDNWKKVRISFPVARRIFRSGFATGLQWVFEMGAFSIAVLMMGWISDDAQAAHLIAISIASGTYMIVSGISAASSVRVGNQVGLKNNTGIRRAAFSGFHLAIAFMFVCAIVLLVTRGSISAAFSKNDHVIGIASSLLGIAAFFQLFDGLQAVALGNLRGVNDTAIPTTITLIAYWGIALPASYLLSFKAGLGPNGVWYGLSVGLFASALMLLIRFEFISRKKF